jgi:hydroxypyruvate reductase
MEPKRKHLESIFLEGVRRAYPYDIIKNSVSLKDNKLKINLEKYEIIENLEKYDKIYVIGAGKATATMAKAIEEILKNKIERGLISVKYGHTSDLKIIDYIEAGHPVPDENGFEAGKKILDIAKNADENSLVITLISGGGSALLTHPYVYEGEDEKINVRLEDIQDTTNRLLKCGAIINEINCLRKHLSAIKGGKLARALYPAKSINLILSDVVGDRLDTIASGPTSPDDTTFEEMERIIKKYEIRDNLPRNVLKILEKGLKKEVEETPKEGNRIFENTKNILIGTNYQSLLACKNKAKSLGYNTLILSSQVVGEAKEVAKVLSGIGKDAKKHDLLKEKPLCIIAGGETTVTLTGDGKGGRNQEIALSYLSEIEKEPDSYENMYFLSASTDGNDGPTDAAGAYADLDLFKKSKEKDLSIDDYLKNNDSYHFFEKIDGLIKTGPTNTNVCDIHLILIEN